MRHSPWTKKFQAFVGLVVPSRWSSVEIGSVSMTLKLECSWNTSVLKQPFQHYFFHIYYTTHKPVLFQLTIVWKQEWSWTRNGGLRAIANTLFSTIVHSMSSSWWCWCCSWRCCWWPRWYRWWWWFESCVAFAVLFNEKHTLITYKKDERCWLLGWGHFTWMMMSFFRILIAYSSSVPFLSASITFAREIFSPLQEKYFHRLEQQSVSRLRT